MTLPLDVEVSTFAARQIEVADRWWRNNRPKAPDAIVEELERALRLIAAQPRIGAQARNTALRNVRRVLLARVRYYLYYRVTDPPAKLEVLALWHASREIDPPLR